MLLFVPDEVISITGRRRRIREELLLRIELLAVQLHTLIIIRLRFISGISSNEYSREEICLQRSKNYYLSC